MNWKWIFLMAWRDSRKNRGRLFLFISSIILGIAALVAMNTFNTNLQKDIDLQAAGLIGADLHLETGKEPTKEALAFIDSMKAISVGYAQEERFVSMVRFPKADGSRLVQVRALTGPYPFYGEIETKPTDGFSMFGKQKGVFVENSLMLQFNAQVKDSVQLGNNGYPILGNILSQPGSTSFAGAMAPTIYVPLEQLENSGLRQQGSRIEHHFYFKLPPGYPIDQRLKAWEKRIELTQLRSSTIQTTKENTGRSFADLASFMELVGFVALLLGCIGVSSAVQIYVREKLLSVAVLRCIGATAKQAFFIFLIQFAGIGLLGGFIGAILGSLIQFLIPLVLQDVLPVAITTGISWFAIVEGMVLGVIIAVLFALLPLLAVRNISPLNSLRITDKEESLFKDPLKWWIYLLIIGFITLFARLQMDDWIQTIVFVFGVGITFLLLYGVAKLFTGLVRRFFPKGWNYLWRQGLSNLYRPNNQTSILIVSIGLGTALITTMFLVQDLLINRVKLSSEQNQANMLLFDIQPSQKDSLESLAQQAGYPIMESVPIVTMQLEKINGRGLEETVADTSADASTRAFRGEIRATYRDGLTIAEKLTDGEWVPEVGPSDTAAVSLDKSYAENLKAKVGDILIFNVQGLDVPAKVSSIREVDWNRFQSNFRVVFAKGTIDKAPQFYVMMTKVPTETESSKFQQQVVNGFPNVSVIDMNTVLQILQQILDKIGFVIQFMGGFSILTGIIVLISSVRISKYQRIRENVLLRTLGASKHQIYMITISEYLFLGLLSALTGIILAILASFLLAYFVFEVTFVVPIATIILILVAIVIATVVIGMLNSLSVLNRSPLEALRRD